MVYPLVCFSFQPVPHDWCKKGCGMCYPVCGMMHIKEPLLLIGKNSPCGGSGFTQSLSVLFNDALNTFYLQLYGIGHMVKNHSDSKRGNPLPPHGLLFPINSKVLLYASSHIQDNTYHGLCYTSRGTLAGSRNSSMGPPRRIDPKTHRTMSEHSYHGATSRSWALAWGFVKTKYYIYICICMYIYVYYFSFQPVLHDWCNKGRGVLSCLWDGAYKRTLAVNR